MWSKKIERFQTQFGIISTSRWVMCYGMTEYCATYKNARQKYKSNKTDSAGRRPIRQEEICRSEEIIQSLIQTPFNQCL